MAGHAAEIDRLKEAWAEKDRAFLMALVLTEEGARLDKEGGTLSAIAAGIKRGSASPVEKRVLDRADAIGVL